MEEPRPVDQGKTVGPIHDLLQVYIDVFTEPQGLHPPRSHDHAINLLPQTKLVLERPYYYPYFQKDEIKKIVKELLNLGDIQPSQSPYSSPVLLVRKVDGTWRLWVDYQALNQVTIKDKFLIPVAEELMDELHGFNICSKLDLRIGYH